MTPENQLAPHRRDDPGHWGWRHGADQGVLLLVAAVPAVVFLAAVPVAGAA